MQADRRHERQQQQRHTDDHQGTAMNARANRLQREKEWESVRIRWKKRKYDLRNEIDIGGSMNTLLNNHHQQQQNNQMKKRNFIVATHSVAVARNDKHMVMSPNVESDDIVLRPLLPDSSPAQPIMENDSVHHSRVWHDQLDDWTLGYQQPKVAFNYFTKVPPVLLHQRPKRKSLSASSSLLASVSVMPANVEQLQKNGLHYHYFPSANQDSSMGFLHSRGLAYVAARLLPTCAVSNYEPSIIRRILYYLWDSTFLDARVSRPVLHMTRRLGQNLQRFLECSFNNNSDENINSRVTTGRKLGLLPKQQQWFGGTPQAYRGELQKYYPASDTRKLLHPHLLRHKRKVSSQTHGADASTAPPLLPGIIPPDPELPLDFHAIILGPRDPFHDIISTREGIDDVRFPLVLSYLMSRLLLSEITCSTKEGTVEKLKDCILSLVDASISMNHRKLYNLSQLRPKTHPEPLHLGFVQSVENLFSLIAASGWTSKRLFSNVRGTGLERSFENDCLSSRIAKCRPHFASLHTTFSLLHLCHVLPRSVHEILDRPFEEESRTRTPFDMMRQALEHLEASHFLVDASVASMRLFEEESMVIIEDLENLLYNMALRFASIVTLNPNDLNSHCWHVAYLACCLLLCSGNQIQPDVAYIYPSFAGDGGGIVGDLRLLTNSSRNIVQHEIRKRLPKFDQLRMQTSNAFRRIVLATKEQPFASRIHLAVASFLEWPQLIALLIGPCYDVDSKFRRIRSLHLQHLTRWVVHSPALKGHAVETGHDNSMTRNDTLNNLASAVESDPSDFNHWINLAIQLGSFNCDSNVKNQRSWWGYERLSWWDSILLHLSISNDVCASTFPWKGFVARYQFIRFEDSSPEIADEAEWFDDSDRMIGSLPSHEIPSIKARRKNYSDSLPSAGAANVSQDLAAVDNMSHSPHPFLRSVLSETNFLLVKLIIRGHMYGMSDPMFERGVTKLAQDSWDEKEKLLFIGTNSLLSLEFLFSRGLSAAPFLEKYK